MGQLEGSGAQAALLAQLEKAPPEPWVLFHFLFNT
jgi:hypothetical protein